MPHPQHPGRTVHELQIAHATLVAAVYNDWNGMNVQHSIYTCTTGLLAFGITHLPTHFAERRAKGDALGRSLKDRARQCSVMDVRDACACGHTPRTPGPASVKTGDSTGRTTCTRQGIFQGDTRSASASTYSDNQQTRLASWDGRSSDGCRVERRQKDTKRDNRFWDSQCRTLFYIPRN